GHSAVLHSFPTRRSSDLLGDECLLQLTGAKGGHVTMTCHRRSRWATGPFGMNFGTLRSLARKAPSATFSDRSARKSCGRSFPGKDRKSTRLNSSHVKISY